MKEFVRGDSLLIYILCSVSFMDIMFRVATAQQLFSINLLLSFVFLIPVAIFIYFICSFFQNRASHILSVFLLGTIAIIYSSQLVYFKIFRTFFSIYSVGNGGQVLDFWKDIGSLLLKNSYWILLVFLPVLVLTVVGRKIVSFKKIECVNRLSLIGCIIIAQLAGIGLVYASGKEQHSAYDLYYNNNFPLLAVDKLGLVTSMRLDLQRRVTGWSPSLEVMAPIEPEEISPSPTMEEPTPVEENEEYNIMDIDFSSLVASEANPEIKEMHKYFESVEPTAKNDYTGKFKGYNLIFITAEGFSPYAVDQEVTPTLYKLVHEGYNFTNFYTPLWEVSTSDGEYVACTGLIPKSGVWSFQQSANNYLPFVMGNQFKKLSYKTLAYHNHSYSFYDRHLTHPNMGYAYKGLGNGLNVKKTWPESDLEMMEKTVSEYINNQPFHAYYMTVSGHLQYNFTGNYIAHKNKKYVKDLPYSDQAKAYLATQIELDRALEVLLTQLEAAGIADKTLIALSADHYPYGLELETINEFAGHKVDENFELYRSPFIIYTKGMEPTTIDKLGSSLDIIPTLSNLLGLEYDSRLLMGRDIFSDSESLVLFLNKSFITDKGSYNSITGEFDGEEVDDSYIQAVSATVQRKFYYSTKILENDYYRKVLKE